MKAIEILSENKRVDEAPAGILGQAAKRIGAGLLSAAGLKTWAGSINDKADVGTFANRYSREFGSYLKTAGRTADSATLGDLKDFMEKNKIPVHNVPNNPTGTADSQMVNAILNKTAQDVLSATTATTTANVPTSASSGNAASAASSGQATQTSTSGSQPFNVPALLQVIPQMNKRDLNKILAAAQGALQNPNLTSKKAASIPAPTSTANMTPAQTRATKQAAAANIAQAQMKTTPAAATTATPTPAQTRATKQAAAGAAAQAQMTPAPQRRVRSRPKKAVAV